MRTISLFATLVCLVFSSGCASFPKPFASKKQSHKTDRIASRDSDNSDIEKKGIDINERLISDEDEEKELTPSNDDIFKEPAKGRHRIKESDGLSSLMKDLIDPRTTEINRNLGYD